MEATAVRARKAVIPAGGFASRLLPLTKVVPKELLPVGGRPLFDHLLEELAAAGLNDALLVEGRNKELIDAYTDDHGELRGYLSERYPAVMSAHDAMRGAVTVHSVRQGGAAGIGIAVLRAAAHVGAEPFAVVSTDDILAPSPTTLTTMIDEQRRHGGIVLAAIHADPAAAALREAALTEAVEPAQDGLTRVLSVSKRPGSGTAAGRTMTLIGRYVLPPEVFPPLADAAAAQARALERDGHADEVQLVEIIDKLIADGMPAHAVLVRDGHHDIGSPVGFMHATCRLYAEHPALGGEFRAWATRFAAGQG